MNAGPLWGSVVVAAVLTVLLAGVIQLMIRGWRKRADRQTALIGAVPDLPDEVGEAELTDQGVYVGSTLSPSWDDRVAVGDLGYRGKAVLTRYPEGLLLVRSRAQPIWIPTESILAIRTERAPGGTKSTRGDILAIRWRLPSGVDIDTGFRADPPQDYGGWTNPTRPRQ